MTDSTVTPADPNDPTAILKQLRARIDTIDADIHAALIERGEIIDELIAVKRADPGRSAFRPAREVAMMRRLIARHRGILPLDTVESIWRVIIATFTYIQAPFSLHVAGGDPMLRDVARFHFGFTVPLVQHTGPAEAVAAVAASDGDLALVPAAFVPGRPWWTALCGKTEPKVIARLPFVERADHPASLPVYVLSRPVEEGAVTEVTLAVIGGVNDRIAQSTVEPVTAAIGTVLDRTHSGGHWQLLVALDGSQAPQRLVEGLVEFSAKISCDIVGSHAARYDAP